MEKTIKTGLMLALIAFSMHTVKASQPTPQYTHGQFTDAFIRALNEYSRTFNIKDLKRNRSSLLKAITDDLAKRTGETTIKSTPARLLEAVQSTFAPAVATSTAAANTAVSAPVNAIAPRSVLPTDPALHTDDLMPTGLRFSSPIFATLARPLPTPSTAHATGAFRIGMPIIFRPHTATSTAAPTNAPSASSGDILPDALPTLSLGESASTAAATVPLYGQPVATEHTDQKHSAPRNRSAAAATPAHVRFNDISEEDDNDPQLAASVRAFLASEKEREESEIVRQQTAAASSYSAASKRSATKILKPMESAHPSEHPQSLKNMIGIHLAEIQTKRKGANKKRLEDAVDKVLKEYLGAMGYEQLNSFESRLAHFKDNKNDCLGFLTVSNLNALQESLRKINAAFVVNTTRKK